MFPDEDDSTVSFLDALLRYNPTERISVFFFVFNSILFFFFNFLARFGQFISQIQIKFQPKNNNKVQSALTHAFFDELLDSEYGARGGVNGLKLFNFSDSEMAVFKDSGYDIRIFFRICSHISSKS